jgi:glutamine cyclotransferase
LPAAGSRLAENARAVSGAITPETARELEKLTSRCHTHPAERRARPQLRRDNRVVRFFRVQVVQTMPHPVRGFTQGLLAEGGMVVESGGQYGMSVLRRYPVGAMDASTEMPLADELFGEGICRVGDTIWQLTWKERVALRWDAITLQLSGMVSYNRDGWGICAVPAGERTDAGGWRPSAPAGEGTGRVEIAEVITSDGTSELVRRDPVTLEPRSIVHVRCQGWRVRWLNDLAWSGGLVWANVLGTEVLAGIDLATGEVTDVADAHRAGERHTHPQMMMNGIAALPMAGEFLLTGKGYRSIRHVRLVPDRDRGHLDRMLTGPTVL